MNSKTGFLIAASAAALLASTGLVAGGSAAAAKEKIHCAGINGCKGHAECATPGGNGCAGMNSCKGKGWVSTTEADCKAKGGTVMTMEGSAPAAMSAPAASAPAK